MIALNVCFQLTKILKFRHSNTSIMNILIISGILIVATAFEDNVCIPIFDQCAAHSTYGVRTMQVSIYIISCTTTNHCVVLRQWLRQLGCMVT